MRLRGKQLLKSTPQKNTSEGLRGSTGRCGERRWRVWGVRAGGRGFGRQIIERKVGGRKKEVIKIDWRRYKQEKWWKYWKQWWWWWVARALAVQLPVVTMVTDSHGACVVQPMSAGLGVWGANCARRGKWGGVSFFPSFWWKSRLYQLPGREGPYVSCVLMILAHKRCGLVT